MSPIPATTPPGLFMCGDGCTCVFVCVRAWVCVINLNSRHPKCRHVSHGLQDLGFPVASAEMRGGSMRVRVCREEDRDADA